MLLVASDVPAPPSSADRRDRIASRSFYLVVNGVAAGAAVLNTLIGFRAARKVSSPGPASVVVADHAECCGRDDLVAPPLALDSVTSERSRRPPPPDRRLTASTMSFCSSWPTPKLSTPLSGWPT